MKNYLVVVECEDYVNIDAETEEEAIEQAIEQARATGLHEWTASVVHREEVKDDCDIPY